MLKTISLHGRLMGSFLLMGGVVLAIGAVGWRGTHQLSSHLDTISQNSLPSINGLWKINEGQTQIQSAERALTNPELSFSARQAELNRVQTAWKQIDAGFEEYDATDNTPEEEQLYQTFKQQWQVWKQDHSAYLQAYQNFVQLGIANPTARQAELISQGRGNSPEMKAAIAATDQLTRLRQFVVTKNDASFKATADSLLQLIKINQEIAEDAERAASVAAQMTAGWVIVGIIVGPLGAIFLGLFLSNKIAKPLTGKIAQIVQTVATSTTEIATTIEQQERNALQQATSVNQTTTTMDELGASSRQSAEQAEASAVGAQQVLMLVDGRSQDGQISQSSLREKVGDIANQILHLSQQTNQIGSISTLVSDLANQTNMLALNAAVEAVRAGEHGKGFAVVAAEIRKLADQSKKSAEKINTLVADIQNSTNSTVMVTDEGTKTVEKIVDAMKTIALNGQQIALNSNQQAVAVQQVVAAMNSLNITAQETASGISQIKAGTQRLNDAAQELKAVV
ncbi:MAG: methyl-accepting chemotaxis protein [Leptolyngbyaceae cyanobacterium bins.302]|nr:methyl-accepting chemotaxis protein [Leptolyngbyaceae cyanobacterium bins.302]